MSPLAQHYRDAEARARGSASLVARGIGLNFVLAIAKIAGGVFGHTYALIADGVESLLDMLSSALVWGALRMAGRPPDADHPYGHGKAESLAGLLVSGFIFAAAIWIGEHAIHQIVTPHQGPRWETLPLLAVIIGVKFFFSRRLSEKARESGSTTVEIEAGHQYSDALTSAAAFIGISIALIGGPRYQSADGWAALAACAVIFWNGIVFLRKALNDVMDTAAPGDVDLRVREAVATVAGVQGIDKLRVRKSGLSHLVDIHVEVNGSLSVREGHDIAGAVKHRLLESDLHITDVLVHIEPAPDMVNS